MPCWVVLLVVTRADVDRLVVLNRRISDLVIADLNKFWLTLDMSLPETARDRLLEFLPLLVAKYGDVAATVSADWYAQVRSEAKAPGRFSVPLAPNTADAKTIGTTRRLAADLFAGKPEDMLYSLHGAITKYALQSGRDTIDLAARRDPWRPKVARVPTGATTCRFCLLLASRGAVYSSKQKAGETTKFHPHDDCQIVVVGKGQDLPEGYDPDELYEQYKSDKPSKKKPSGPPDPAEIERAKNLNAQSYEAYQAGDLDRWSKLQAEAREIIRAAYNATGAGLDSN